MPRLTPRSASVGLLALVCLLAGSGADGAKPAPLEEPLRVATWDLHWFGHPKHPRSSLQLSQMASHIAGNGVHVLAFQDAAVTRLGPSGEHRSYALDEMVRILEDEHGQQWEYWIHRGKGEQHLGFLWRSDRVDLVASPVFGLGSKKAQNLLVDKKGKEKKEKRHPWPRIPVLAHVSTGEGLTDFTLVNVHLEEPRPQYGMESYWETRRAACESLARWIRSRWDEGSPAVPDGSPVPVAPPKGAPHAAKLKGKPVPFPKLMGKPVPMQPGLPMASKVAYDQILGFVDPDLAVLGGLNAPVHPEVDAAPLLSLGMHLIGGDDPTHAWGAMDRVIVSVPMGEEYAVSQVQTSGDLSYAVAGPKQVGGSDHLMVSFTVAVRGDDD